MLSMPTAPLVRLRSKTPDPSHRVKSPHPKELKKAAKKLRRGKPSQKKLSFDDQPKVTEIVAENPAGECRPSGARKSKKKMSLEEADVILAKYAKDKDRSGDGLGYQDHILLSN